MRVLQLRLNKATLGLGSAQTVIKCLFNLFSARFFALLCFSLATALFKMALEWTADESPGIPQSKKVVLCLIQKMQVR